ncbi:MAG: ATP-dependent Lhr-like helicase [Lysobacterales bacterium]|jgi:ATP-dependent Lhr-like helicase
MINKGSMPGFHPIVQRWFDATFKQATPVQIEAWSAIAQKQNVLVAAPTGSGKTLAAFLGAISDLVDQSRQQSLDNKVYVLYISPLKALSNDIERNLQLPLQGIEQLLADDSLPPSGIRALVRTGDTPQGDREKMRRKPPQILVTTPESLYLLLTSVSGRDMLRDTATVIVDEIHAVAGNKRGSHLSLSLARLDALCGNPPARIGLSATQKPIERIADFLCGGKPCAIVDTGHKREWDLQLEMPQSPMSAVLANEIWEEVYDRLEILVNEHTTTLIFVNTRRLAERLTRHLAERLGDEVITAHHGSLSREHRLEAEQALKSGQLKALVATASLELGIDIGHVDLVCQLGSPGSISGFLQRVGRSGHTVGETPKGRLFPLSRDDLVECVALTQAVENGDLDAICIPCAPLDVLSQQLVAEISARDWGSDEIYAMCRSAWPYKDLARESFDAVIEMLANGYSTRRGRRSAWLFHDAINKNLKARPAARLTALQNGGAIPDHFDYEVLMLPQGHRVGSLNEDFAFESLPGDIFQLGNTSYRILKIEQGRVLVEDAAGLPPTIPFWFGDAPGRSDELSDAVSNLRKSIQEKLETIGALATTQELLKQGLCDSAAEQLVSYLHASLEALGTLPTKGHFVLERFFDDTGDMHLVIHAPLGSRLMRAWGLALRKRFCRQFNFELQASALEDSLILSLGETHSFELSDVPAYLKSGSVRQVLIQALLDAPMFDVRWRWNATISLAIQRMRNGQRLPPQWQRNQAEDLVAVVFPDQIACLENIRGAREIPDHPLVQQTIDDCLYDSMDIEGLESMLAELEDKSISISCVDLTGPSPLSREIINARPYAFLDDGDAENRRTRAISQDPDDLGHASTLRIISIAATDQVRNEAWINPRNADELHDGLLQLGFLTQQEIETGNSSSGATGDATYWPDWFAVLVQENRVCSARLVDGSIRWLASERLHEWQALHNDCQIRPDPAAYFPEQVELSQEQALVSLLRDRLAGLGPVTLISLAQDFALESKQVEVAMASLQNQGFAIAMLADGQIVGAETLWCERRLLARIHRYSRAQRRHAVKPVSPAAFGRFLVQWHGMGQGVQDGGTQAESGLDQALSQLEGWTAPVPLWEKAILGIRCRDYSSQELDQRFLSGELCWFRPARGDPQLRQVVNATPVAIVPREAIFNWQNGPLEQVQNSSAYADQVRAVLEKHGAMFTRDIEDGTGLLRPHLEEGLKALVYNGSVTADAFSPLRWLLRPEKIKARQEKRRQPALPVGRWSLVRQEESSNDTELHRPSEFRQQQLSAICKALLRRYGVVFRAGVQRETLLPPWRQLLAYLRRMEDRGEVRGGRFVDGFSGEQFALPEAVGLLRQNRDVASESSLVVISAADPLNLGGWILTGPRTPSAMNNRILLENGLPVARMIGDEVEELKGISKEASAKSRDLLTIVRPWRRYGN